MKLQHLFTCLLPIVCLSGTSAAPSDADHPNVIVIISDDQGWADIGYNNPAVYTPNLDRLAREGATLVNNYVMPSLRF